MDHHHPPQHKPTPSPFNYIHDHAFPTHPPIPFFHTHTHTHSHPPLTKDTTTKKFEKEPDSNDANADGHTHLVELLNALPLQKSQGDDEEVVEEKETVGAEEPGRRKKTVQSGHDGGDAPNYNESDNVSAIIHGNTKSKKKRCPTSVNVSARTKSNSVVSNALVCQIEGCINGDLRKAKKDYHRRHKVCEMHSKAPLVIKSGLAQRFCQQCSRFHVVSEFDDAKRSCRRRLEGHNRRRRKPTYSPTFIASAASLLQLGYHDKLQQLVIQHHDHQFSRPVMATSMQQFLQGKDFFSHDHHQVTNRTPLIMVASNPLEYVNDIDNRLYAIGNHDGLSSSPSLLHLQHEHRVPMPMFGDNHCDSILQGKGMFPTTSGDVCAPSCALSLLSSNPLGLTMNDHFIASTNEGNASTLQDMVKIPNLNHISYNHGNHISSIPNVGGLFDLKNGPALTMSSMPHTRKDRPFFMVANNQAHYDSDLSRLGYSWS